MDTSINTTNKEKIKVGIVGGSGYVGEELVRLLLERDDISIGIVTSQSLVGKEVTGPHGPIGLIYSAVDYDMLNTMDIVFLAVPHGKAQEMLPHLTCKVIDMTSDHRLTESYGLPEVFADKIKGSRVVANPGCYATACILSVYPIKDMISHVVFDGISGYSGAGKNGDGDYTDNVIAYKLTNHNHLKEMREVLGVPLSFTPHVVDTFRGLMCTAHVFLKEDAVLDVEEVKKKYTQFYSGTGLGIYTKIVSDVPCVKDVVGTPFCHIGGFSTDENGCLVIVSVIDNLMKGAASQAIENMDLMFS